MVAFSKLPVMLSDEDVVDKRYENGKIYLVKCKYDDELVYVGSTFQTLDERLRNHRTGKRCSLYQYVNNDWDNWYIELYEDYPCKNKYILEKRETEVQREIANINKQLARRTKKEYNQDNRDKLLEKKKKYHHDNRDKILEQKKQYHHDNRDKILEKMKQNYQANRDKYLEQMKQYHQANRDKCLEQKKQYYHNNREKISEQSKQKITCERCGSIIRKTGFREHQQSKKCLNYNVGNN